MANFKPTPKQKAFALAMADPKVADQSAAYVIAYSTKRMSAKSIAQEASRLMANPNITSMIDALTAPVFDKLHISLETVLSEVAKIAFSNVDDFIEIGENGKASLTLSKIGRDELAAVKKVKTNEVLDQEGDVVGYSNEFELADKLKALEMLGRHVGAFPKEVVQEGDTNINQTVFLTKIELARQVASLLEDAVDVDVG